MNPPGMRPAAKNTLRHGARHLEWVKTGRGHPVALKAETGNEAEFSWRGYPLFLDYGLAMFFPGVLFLLHTGLLVWNGT